MIKPRSAVLDPPYTLGRRKQNQALFTAVRHTHEQLHKYLIISIICKRRFHFLPQLYLITFVFNFNVNSQAVEQLLLPIALRPFQFGLGFLYN
jgi:hypothetical protein